MFFLPGSAYHCRTRQIFFALTKPLAGRLESVNSLTDVEESAILSLRQGFTNKIKDVVHGNSFMGFRDETGFVGEFNIFVAFKD